MDIFLSLFSEIKSLVLLLHYDTLYISFVSFAFPSLSLIVIYLGLFSVCNFFLVDLAPSLGHPSQ
jgi:hypothetical protein